MLLKWWDLYKFYQLNYYILNELVNEMTLIASELNGAVTMADLTNWNCLNKAVGSKFPGV